MKKIALFTDSAFALFSAEQLLKAQNQKADLLTIKDFWVERFTASTHIRPQLIKPWSRGLARYLPYSQKRKQSQQQILEYFRQQKPDEIWFHEIYSDLWNWIAYAYKSLYPHGIIRLLPESFLNATDFSVSSKKAKSNRFKAFINQNYTPFNGQWIGLNAQYKGKDLIQNIYLPQGFPHFYPENKVAYFNFSLPKQKPIAHKAILVEQALLDRKMLSQNQLKEIYQNLQKDWQKHNITEIYIAPHPRAKQRDFAFANLPLLERSHVFLEEDIAAQNFGHIYSSYSMIFLSKTQLKSRFISFGLDIVNNFSQKEDYISILKKLEVEFITTKNT